MVSQNLMGCDRMGPRASLPFPFSIQGSGQLGEEKPGEEVLLAVLRCQVEQASDLLVLETGAGAGVL